MLNVVCMHVRCGSVSASNLQREMARDEDQVRDDLVEFGTRVRAATRIMQTQLQAILAEDENAAPSSTPASPRGRGRTVRCFRV